MHTFVEEQSRQIDQIAALLKAVQRGTIVSFGGARDNNERRARMDAWISGLTARIEWHKIAIKAFLGDSSVDA
ncbi:MAG: hypothetical protein ACT4OU_01115 [Hyphomicrobium sp.]